MTKANLDETVALTIKTAREGVALIEEILTCPITSVEDATRAYTQALIVAQGFSNVTSAFTQLSATRLQDAVIAFGEDDSDASDT